MSQSSPRGKISPELLQKIKESVNITDVIGEHVVLRKSGANYTGLCPFHSERSPSFSVTETKQLYHCYGCKKGGDLVSFVMEMHGLSFPEAIEELAERGRVQLPKDFAGIDGGSPEEQKRRAAAREKLSLAHKLNRFVAAFYHGQISQWPAAAEYYRQRGVSSEQARQFYVGAAPAGWENLAHHLTAKKAPLDLAVELGLIRPSQKGARSGTGYFDLFRNRIMLPILDTRGKVVGFGGRIMPGEGEAQKDSPKYLNSPESFLFHKSKVAFGLYQAQKHIREKDEVILVEGYFDVLALHAAGFENAVAICGTSLTPDHLSLFKRFGSKVTVLFDGDKAGTAAVETAMGIGLDQGQVLYSATMPPGLDPDQLLFDQKTGKALPEGREKMAAILAGAKPILDSRIEEVIAGAQGAEARTQALKKIGAWLTRFKDPVGREVRLHTVQTQLGITRQLLDQVIGNKGGVTPAPSAPKPKAALPQPRQQPVAKRPARVIPLQHVEKILLGGLALGAEYSVQLGEARQNLPEKMTLEDFFDHPGARQWVRQLATEAGLLERLRAAPETVLERIEDTQVRSTVTEALVSSDPTFSAEEFKVALMRSMSRCWARFSQQIKNALAHAEAKKDAGLHDQLLKEYLDVQRKMKEFSCFYDEA